jgi:hypothetical protein
MPSGVTKRIGKVLLTSNVPTVEAALEAEMGKRVLEACQAVRNETLQVLSGPRSGRFYRIPGTHRKRQRGSKRFVRAQAPRGGWQEGMATQTGAASLLSTGAGAAGRRGFYRASAPGEPPATRLARLRQSVKYSVRRGRDDAVGVVGTPLEYGVYLEKGTGKMRPRPWLSVGFGRSRAKVRAILTRRMVI